jgi:hypothetical protein
MSDPEGSRSKELEELRLMLFPKLSREEGRRRIDAAFEGAADSERSARIDALASELELGEELRRRIRELRQDELT